MTYFVPPRIRDLSDHRIEAAIKFAIEFYPTPSCLVSDVTAESLSDYVEDKYKACCYVDRSRGELIRGFITQSGHNFPFALCLHDPPNEYE